MQFWALILRPSAVCTLRASSRTWLFLPVVGQRLALMVQTVLEGIEFVGKFVGLAGFFMSPARHGRCGRMWSPCGFCSCRFHRCRSYFWLVFSYFLVQVVEKTVEILQLPGSSRQFVDIPAVVNDSCPDGSDSAVDCGGFCTVAVLLKVVDVPVVLVVQAPQLLVETAVITRFSAVAVRIWLFARFTGIFSHSVLLDVECRVAGTPGACSQVFCHPN